MNFHNPLKSKFSSILLGWNTKGNTRKMPWKGEKDPYKIWLSEIILQQTRVEQGLAYYQEFIKYFPDILSLAQAKEEQVYKLWEGLGYYTRCRNLIETAKYISFVERGRFPESYEKILSLKGIGAYTAAAISSFAYNLPYAVLDGNVYRVLSRVFGIKIPLNSIAAKKEFAELATTLLDKKNPGVYNQALMDFGAVVCKPANPICKDCVFKKYCFAFQNNLVEFLPVKGVRKAPKKRWFYYLVMEYKGRLVVRKRNEKDIWRNLYEFPLVETEKENTIKSVMKLAEKDILIDKTYNVQTVSEIFNQRLSHRHIFARFIKIRLKKPIRQSGLEWILHEKTSTYPFPKIINDYLAAKE